MTILSGVGSPASVGPTSGGSIYGFDGLVQSDLVMVAPANPARRKITFHNPGSAESAAVLYISQTTLQTTGSDVAYDPSMGLGGSFILGLGVTLTFYGECQKAWQVYCRDPDVVGTLTVIDSTTG